MNFSNPGVGHSKKRYLNDFKIHVISTNLNDFTKNAISNDFDHRYEIDAARKTYNFNSLILPIVFNPLFKLQY